MNDRRLRIVKLGGSLLDLSDLADRVHDWLSQQKPANNFFLAGGGTIVESLRELCAHQRIDDSTAHELAMRAMSLTARILADRLGCRVLSLHPSEITSQKPFDELAVLDVYQTICERDPHLTACDLPQSWDVTSDSIAAWMARQSGCQELVLLKSALPSPGCQTWKEVADSAYVDAHFPVVASAVAEVRSVNLRDQAFAEWTPAQTSTTGV